MSAGFLSGGNTGGLRSRLLATIATLVVLSATIGVLIRKNQTSQERHLREAVRISEYGLLQALDSLQMNRAWSAGSSKIPYLGGWFVVSTQSGDSSGVRSLTVVSEGHSGSFVRRHVCRLLLSSSGGDSIWVQQSLKQD